MLPIRLLPNWLFQSTLPTRGATTALKKADSHTDISIHAPHAGSDINACYRCGYQAHFNPRSPRGERQNRVGVGAFDY